MSEQKVISKEQLLREEENDAEVAAKRVYDGAMKQLCKVAFVSIFFIIAQGIGGYLANSIAIYTDTAHLASDMIGFVLSMVSL
jgi:Co/Zn/Cd efflux system component